MIIVDQGWTFAEHCNEGARKTATDVLVFLNDDTIPQPGWLEALIAPFDDPTVGITGAALFYPDGQIQHAGVTLGIEAGVLTARNIMTPGPSREVAAVTGACLAIRRHLFEQLEGFDTEYRNGYEDIDLCLRMRAEGWRIWFAADAQITHLESQSGAARWAHVHDNIRRLHERWAGSHEYEQFVHHER